MMASPPTSSCSPPWHLLPEVLRRVIAHLPFPADRARFRAVCRAWHSAARQHVHQLAWMVFPDASFCTIGGDDGGFFFHRTIPGLPENVTCLGAAADGWLALDRTDDAFRRTPLWDKFSDGDFRRARRDVKHSHSYLLHNPFSGETVPLPELDSIVGDVAETLEIRKVLMRSSSPDDVVAVTTNNWNHNNVILCRPGKGMFVLDDFRVFDVAFLGGRLYGITPEEDLLSFQLDEDGDGSPIVTKFKRVIKPIADGKEDLLSFNGDGGVLDGEDWVEDDGVPYEPKDYITTTRRLVKSRSGEELLMVRHHTQIPPFSRAYTRKVEVFKADIEAGLWVPIVTGDMMLAEGEALFLSRSFCKSTRVYGDIKDGFMYSTSTEMDDVWDTRSGTSKLLVNRLPPQWRSADQSLLTWLFPPDELGV